MSDGAVRRPGVLRRHRRPGLQEDLPGAAGDGEARPPRRAGHRRGEGRLDPRTAPGAGQGQPREARRARSRGVRQAVPVCCATSTATTRTPRRSQAIRKELGPARRPAHYLAIPPVLFELVVEQLAQGGLHAAAPASSSRSRSAGPRLGAGAQPRPARSLRRGVDLPDRPLPRQAAGAQHAVLPLRERASSSRSGTASTSRACRSPWPKTSGSRAAAPSTTRPAPSATWSRTISSRS